MNATNASSFYHVAMCKAQKIQFLLLFLFIFLCSACSSTPKEIRIDEEQLESGFTLEQGQRVSIYTKEKQIITMNVTGYDKEKIEGELLVVDGEKASGQVVEVELANINKIVVGKPDNSGRPTTNGSTTNGKAALGFLYLIFVVFVTIGAL